MVTTTDLPPRPGRPIVRANEVRAARQIRKHAWTGALRCVHGRAAARQHDIESRDGLRKRDISDRRMLRSGLVGASRDRNRPAWKTACGNQSPWVPALCLQREVHMWRAKE